MYNFTLMPAMRMADHFAQTAEAKAAKPKTNFGSSSYKTLIRAVKLTVIIMLFGLLQVSARSNAQTRISLKVRGATLEKVFAEIEKRSGYTVFYNTEVLQAAGSNLVSIDIKDATIDDVMHQCLKGLPLEFSVQDKTIFVKKEARRVALETASGPGSPIPSTLSGIVRTETGTPLVGATVYVLKLKKTVATNKDGEFTLKDVPDGDYEVIISYIGYENYRTKVSVTNHEAWLSADLKESMSKLDETVVKGYYSTTNRLNTGDVTVVKGEDINKAPVSDPMMALEGRVPGLYIQQVSGIPGAAEKIMLRGQNSIANGNNPLFIVDGVPFTSTTLSNPNTGNGAVGGQGLSPFNDLNPADIESIEVLKDADATAIYGSRGANGVILITTKKGKDGKSRVDVNVYGSDGKVTRMYNLLNTKQYLALRHQAFYNDSISNPTAHIKPGLTDYDINGTWDTTRYTNWQKTLIGGTAHFANAQAALSGGNANTQFIIDGGYSRQTTVYPGNYSDQKASVRANINHLSTDRKFKAQFTAQYGNDNSILPFTDFTNQITLAPDAPKIYDANGNINWQNGTWSNPLAATAVKSNAVTNSLLSDLTLEYDVLSNLHVKSSFGYTNMELNSSIQQPATILYGPPSPTNRRNTFGTSSINTWIIEPQIDYSKRIFQGKLDALIGTTIQENVQNSIGELAYGFSSDVLIPNISAASSLVMLGSSNTDYRYNALFGRLSYNWQDKYILNVTARRDGSSRFGPGNKFGNFGAIGAAWVFSKEKLIQDGLPFLSFGKLRASYGTTGNDQIPDYQYLSTYYPYTASSYQGVTGLYPLRISNPYFGWEEVKKLEGGIELGWLKDRIMLSVNYYLNRTGNSLVGLHLPSIDGFTSIQANLPATVQNTGVEAEISTVNFRTKNFTWSSNVNFSVPRNKLTAFPNLATSAYSTTYAIGKPLFIRWQYHYTGVDPQAGIYTFQDVNHDGLINNSDKQFLKQISQNYFGGFLNTFSYKGIQLDVFLQFVKQTATNYLGTFNAPGYFNSNQPTYVLNQWLTTGDKSSVEKATRGAGSAYTAWSNLNTSDYSISDASFIRMKNLSLSYTLPRSWQQKARLQMCRIYVQCQNLFTITQYKGLDPETQKSLPPLRMIAAGLQVAL